MSSRGLLSPQGIIDGLLYIIPIVAPILAYYSYTNVQSAFVQFIDLLSNAKWVAVDGGLYQTQIITPAINGIVVPSVAVLFATLVVTTLRQRQLSIRTSLNMEASELRLLQSMVDSFPTVNDDDNDNHNKVPSISDYQDQCRRYLMQYTIRILAESQGTVNYNTLEYSGSIDSEMNALVSKLNELSRIEHQQSLTRMNPHLLSESYAAITRLNSERSTRISALQSVRPYSG
jgi:poly(A) polymerase Pap1